MVALVTAGRHVHGMTRHDYRGRPDRHADISRDEPTGFLLSFGNLMLRPKKEEQRLGIVVLGQIGHGAVVAGLDFRLIFRRGVVPRRFDGVPFHAPIHGHRRLLQLGQIVGFHRFTGASRHLDAAPPVAKNREKEALTRFNIHRSHRTLKFMA